MQKFIKGQIPELQFRKAVKKPIPVQCFQMNEAFEVETLEGKMQGKAEDWLIVGMHGEMYPIDKEIFEKTYDLVS